MLSFAVCRFRVPIRERVLALAAAISVEVRDFCGILHVAPQFARNDFLLNGRLG